MENNPIPVRIRRKPWYRRPGPLALAAVAAVALWGIGARLFAAHHLREHTEEQAVTAVTVIKAPHGPAAEELVLPGDVQAWHEAVIYARTSGYLKSWTKGMGKPVKEGELLAEIDTPELDAQLHQAEADLKTAEANNALAQSTAKRWLALRKTDSVSQQETDEKLGDAAAKAALLASARANRDRLRHLQSFKHVVAPFDGIITERNTDIGALIDAGNAGNNGASGQELFRVADISRLRIYVKVPQNFERAITPDLTAELHFPEHPERSYPAARIHSAHALAASSRTLLIEFEIDNPDGALPSGTYTEVHINLPTPGDIVRLPVSTLLFRAEGMEVATVDSDGKVLLKPIRIGRDFGNEVEVTSGITPDETVIANPPDSLRTGQPVRIIPSAPPKEAAAPGKSS